MSKLFKPRLILSQFFNHKPIFIGEYTHFDSFLPSTYTILMIHSLLSGCFRICSDWIRLYSQLILFKYIFQDNKCT